MSTRVVVPRSLDEAIGDELNVWSDEAQAGIRARLQLAADGEWATTALAAFDRGPEAFLLHHIESDLEQAKTSIALFRAVGEVIDRTGTDSFDQALAVLGITEAQWLREAGFSVGDQSKENK